jgi:hypothetical protein
MLGAMDIPQYMPIIGSVTCPHCGIKVGMHLVRQAFKCPHCLISLKTNINSAFNKGLFAFLLIFGASVLLAWLIRPNFIGIGSSIAFIIAFYGGHFWYRQSLKLCVFREGSQT